MTDTPKPPARVIPFAQRKQPKPAPPRSSWLDRQSGLRLDVQVTVNKPPDPKTP